MDHTVAYLLLQCCKVKAVPGVAGKVLQMRSFMKTTLGHENPSCTSANELIVFLVSQLSSNLLILFSFLHVNDKIIIFQKPIQWMKLQVYIGVCLSSLAGKEST